MKENTQVDSSLIYENNDKNENNMTLEEYEHYSSSTDEDNEFDYYNSGETIRNLIEGSNNGDKYCQGRLGYMYFFGNTLGINDDPKTGLELLRKSSEQGDIHSIRLLSKLSNDKSEREYWGLFLKLSGYSNE